MPGIKATDPGLQKMIFGAFGLPFGLLMTVLTGAELFTGNAALVPLAMLEGKVHTAAPPPAERASGVPGCHRSIPRARAGDRRAARQVAGRLVAGQPARLALPRLARFLTL